MKFITKPLVVLFSIVACVGAILGWALSSEKEQTYPIQGSFEQHW